VFAVLLAATACAKSGDVSPDPADNRQPPATARDGAPEFAVPTDAEAAVGKAGLEPVEDVVPRPLRLRAHLDVFIDGHVVTVPKGIGVVDEKRSSPLFTLDESGVIHVASPREEATFRLGQFFHQWNVKLDKDCVAGFCASTNPDKQLLAFINGELAADPSTVQLINGAEIVVWYGDKGTNPQVPTTYAFRP
jgi:hypothetical protein